MTTATTPLKDSERTGRTGAAAPVLENSGLSQRLRAGLILSAMLVAAIFGWASVAELSGAVIATGIVVIEDHSKKVQHPQGGVVGAIHVKNGDRVAAGALLVQLDDIQIRASLGVIRTQLIELLGRKARLAAERDNASSITFPTEFAAMGDEAVRVVDGERRLFEARQNLTSSQKAQLNERVKQNEEEIKGLVAQREAKTRELALIRDELSRVSELYRQKLAPITRVLTLQRDETRIGGESGALAAQIARLGSQMAEARLQITTIEQTKFSDAQKELRETEARIAELQEKSVVAEDQLKHVSLKAPIGGTIHELNVHTVGGVVGPAEQLMLVVPNDDTLSIEVRIPAGSISEVSIGRSTTLRFPAFNHRTTPEIKGALAKLSPDVSHDRTSGESYYTAYITPEADFLVRLDGQKLIPGMPVEVFIETEPRTALSYLAKPLSDQFNRAFRER